MAKKIGDKSCQANSDKRASDFGSFLVIELLLYVCSMADFPIGRSQIKRICHSNLTKLSKNAGS